MPKINLLAKVQETEILRSCSKCEETKSLSSFCKDKRGTLGYATTCKRCHNATCNRYYYDNYDRATVSQKTSREKRIDIIRERQRLFNSLESTKQKHRAYYLANKDRIKQRTTSYALRKLKTDTKFKLKHALRHRIRQAIKRGICKGSKVVSAVRDLGCTIDEFKTYMEGKFQPGMSWKNWAIDGWHIDHINPLFKFDLTNPEEAKKAVHYSNLQPLWAKDNLSKGKK